MNAPRDPFTLFRAPRFCALHLCNFYAISKLASFKFFRRQTIVLFRREYRTLFFFTPRTQNSLRVHVVRKHNLLYQRSPTEIFSKSRACCKTFFHTMQRAVILSWHKQFMRYAKLCFRAKHVNAKSALRSGIKKCLDK